MNKGRKLQELIEAEPIAIIISDVHYNLQTLDVADKAMQFAINTANNYNLPLIVAGDLHDTKASMRAECINKMLQTFSTLRVDCYVMEGNHDKINERSNEGCLDFLGRYVDIIRTPRIVYTDRYLHSFCLIPYHHNTAELRQYLSGVHSDYILIMHQGLTGSDSGEYMKDPTAIDPQDVSGRRVVSGHYHRRQTIKLPEDGAWTYLGNPYTLNYGESTHPPKGIHILYSTGHVKFTPCDFLRKHVVYDISEESPEVPELHHRISDLVKVNIKGSKEFLSSIKRDEIAKNFHLPYTFRLDFFPIEENLEVKNTIELMQSQDKILDSVIDSYSNMDIDKKERLKSMWKQFK